MKKVVTIILLFVLISTFLSKASSSDSSSITRHYGNPTISFEYSVFAHSSIDQIVADDSFLYVLYGENNGNVQIFDLDGNYQCTAYFYTHLNGAYRLAVKDNILFVRDERRNLYIFQNGKFDSFIEEEEAASLLSSLEFNNHALNYKVRLGSIWKTDGEKEKCIVQRPLTSALYQNNFMFYLSLFLVMAFGLTHIHNRKAN